MPLDEFTKSRRLELVVTLYARGALPIGKAMDIAGLVRRDFERVLSERKVRRPFDQGDLDKDLALRLSDLDCAKE